MARRARLKAERAQAENRSIGEILQAAGKRALGGGIPGACAMGLQVKATHFFLQMMGFCLHVNCTRVHLGAREGWAGLRRVPAPSTHCGPASNGQGIVHTTGVPVR